MRTFVAVCRDRDDDDAFIARNELMIDHVAWARASVHRYEVANASHAPRAYVYKDVALLSADELYTTGNLVVVMAHSRADFEACLDDQSNREAGGGLNFRDSASVRRRRGSASRITARRTTQSRGRSRRAGR